MEYVRKNDTIVVRLEKGEEVVSSLKALQAKEGIRAAAISGIGATNNATIGVLRTADKRYMSKKISEDTEIASLIGNMSVAEDGGAYLHLHVTLGGKDNVYAGHLNEAYVSATAEIYVTVLDGVTVGRRYDEVTGLNLMKFEE